MKNLIFLCAIAMLAIFAMAQATGPAGASIGFDFLNGKLCASPRQGVAYLCGNATDVQESLDGGPYFTLKGKDGINGTTPTFTGFHCAVMSTNALGGVTGSGCTFN